MEAKPRKQGETVWFQLRELRPHIESLAQSLAKLVALLEAESTGDDRGRKSE